MTNTSVTDPIVAGLEEMKKKGFQFFLWRGIIAVLAGILFIIWPFQSALVASLVIGIWMIVDGFVTAALAFDLKKAGASWGWTLTGGIVGIIAGVLVLFFPGVFTLVNATFIWIFLSISLIVQGIMEMTAPKPMRTGWGIVFGILNVIFGIILAFMSFTSPAGNVVSLSWVIGIFAIVLGGYMLYMSYKIHSLGKN